MFVEAATNLREMKSGVALLWKAPKAYDSHRDKLLRRVDAETEHSWVAKKRSLGCLPFESFILGTTTSEGEIGGGPVSAIEGQLQKTVDADVLGGAGCRIFKQGDSVSDSTMLVEDGWLDHCGGRSVDCAGNTVKAEMDEGQKAYKGVSTTAAVAVVSGAQQLISSHGHGAKTILIYRYNGRWKNDGSISVASIRKTLDDKNRS
ncbi:hypothetical protein Tco_0226442 [Tanacetum coccineum]